jgi:WD40 repeat protein
VTSLAFSPDVRWLAASTNNKGIPILDAHTLEKQAVKETHTKLNATAFSPDNTKLASLSDAGVDNRTIQFWDTTTSPVPIGNL